MLYLVPLLVSLILSLLPAHGLAYEYNHNRFHKNPVRQAPKDFRDYHHIARRNISTAVTGASNGVIPTDVPYQNYTFSNTLRASPTVAGTVTVSATTTVSGATTRVATVPAYSVFDSAANSYSIVYVTKTTTACDATLTGFFTRVTVTDCSQSVTFSTKSSFYLIATTPSAALAARQAATTSIQSVVSYFVAPWQSIAANTPNGITIVVCTINADGSENCSGVREVVATIVTTVPMTQTATLTVSQYFPNVSTELYKLITISNMFQKNARVVIGGQNIAVNSGAQQFTTVVVYTTMASTMILTVTATQPAAAQGPTTRTTTMRSTVEQMGNIVTVTAQASSAAASSSSSVEP